MGSAISKWLDESLDFCKQIANSLFQELKRAFLDHALNLIPEELLSSVQSILKKLTASCNPKDYFKDLLTWLRAKAAKLGEWTRRHQKPILWGLVAFAIVITVIHMPHLVIKVIHAIGFQSKGVVAGSLAAHSQATLCGASIARGSLFATLQSIGAGGSFNLATLALAVMKSILTL